MTKFDSNIPIYIQVMETIKMDVMSGQLKPNDKIPSVRELALSLSVNPNTIQKALSELEREGFLVTERAVGRYVADNQQLIQDCKNKEIQKHVNAFMKQMKLLGMDKSDVLLYLQNHKEEL